MESHWWCSTWKVLRIRVASRIIGGLVEGRSREGVLLVIWVIVVFGILDHL